MDNKRIAKLTFFSASVRNPEQEPRIAGIYSLQKLTNFSHRMSPRIK